MTKRQHRRFTETSGGRSEWHLLKQFFRRICEYPEKNITLAKPPSTPRCY